MPIIHFRRLQSLDPFVSHFTKRGEELTGKLLYKNMDATCLEIHTSLAVKCGNIKKISKGFIEFDLYERGKIRHISSVYYRKGTAEGGLRLWHSSDYGKISYL